VSEPDDVQETIGRLAQAACMELFEAYGVAVTPTSDSSDNVLGDAPTLTGVVGFTGPGLHGMCLIASTDAALRASCPVEGSLRDWMAELVNQLVGRLKHKLLAHGAVVYITTPVVMQGARVQPRSPRGLKQTSFSYGAGGITLWVDVEIADGFALSEYAEIEGIAEGEGMLF
jgi:CheY-specific phosphatase CheX